jgi:hypothetical protein
VARERKKQANGEVRTFAHSNLIERLWHVLNYYTKHIYNTIPGDGKEEDYMMEAMFRRNMAALSIDER